MRKRLAFAGVAGLAALALGFWLWPSSGPDATSSASSEPSVAVRDAAKRRAALANLARFAVAPAQAGELSGKVVGPGAAGAHVALAGMRLNKTVTTDAEGAFKIGELPPGEYKLDASAGEMAAETLGPIPLGAGEQIGGLVLQLVQTGSVSGQVLDAATRGPVPNALLTAGGASAATGDDGSFDLRGLPPGEATLSVACAGYVSSSTHITVPRGKKQTGVTLVLTRAAHVAGTVSRSDGTPVAGAMVFAERYDFGAVADASVLGTTADDGTFAGDVAPGRVTLRATAQTGEAKSNELELHAGDVLEGQKLVLDVGGDIVGQIFEADGSPAAGATVLAVEIESQRASGAVSAGPDGRYQISGLPAGVYAVVARSGPRAAQQAGIRIEPGDTQKADVRFGGATVEGVVVDASNQPLVGAQVSASPEGAAMVAATGVEAGPGGHFKLEGLSGTRFALKATHPSGTAELHGVAADARGVVLKVAAQSELWGTVFDDQGQAVTDLQVVADPLVTTDGAARAMGHFASVSGEFHLPCAPGKYRVRVAATGYSTETTQSEAPAHGKSNEIRLTLRHDRTITGTVVDGRNNAPVAGAHVATRSTLLYAFGRASPAHQGGWTATDATGHFTLRDAEPGQVTLFASAEGHGFARPLQVGAESSGPVQLVLQGGGQNQPEDFAGVGMQLDPSFHITQVFDSGPADLAGVRAGDTIVSIDGQPVAGRPLGDVINEIRGEVGTPVAVTVQRDGQTLTLVPTRAQVKF
ncbi:MAG: carboxypeptidase regulatory-like domain-containing protein [Deltaproteobacteria bacterium]|nr:carboxypeptidase regulatory-like domain-containing protein [Deltaproteobacteria bacterium]